MTPSPSRCFGGEGECKGGLSGSDKGFPLGGYAHGSSLPPMQLHNSRRRAPAQKPGHRARPPSSPLEPGLGVLLLDFFRLYGRVINMKEVRAVHGGEGGGACMGGGTPPPRPHSSRQSELSHQLHLPHTSQVGISATGGGHYFPKHDKDGVSWVTGGREYMLSVEDPKDATNDICRCGSVKCEVVWAR